MGLASIIWYFWYDQASIQSLELMVIDVNVFDGKAAKWVWGAFFTALALLGNVFSLSIGFNIVFIFGSIFGLMAVVLLGPLPGFIVSLIGASYTYVIWNHPYSIIIFALEAAWLALLLARRPKISIFFSIFFYWLIIGIPLVFLFYSGVMSLDFDKSAIIAIKQSLNGISNALLASVLISYLPLAKMAWARPQPIRKKSADIL